MVNILEIVRQSRERFSEELYNLKMYNNYTTLFKFMAELVWIDELMIKKYGFSCDLSTQRGVHGFLTKLYNMNELNEHTFELLKTIINNDTIHSKAEFNSRLKDFNDFFSAMLRNF
jgi:hypothetical protein